MKLNLKKNLEDTVNQYRDHTGEFSKKFMAEMGRFNLPEVRNRYSNDGLWDLANEKHAELLASQVATGETMNQKARAVVNGVKSSITAAVMGKGSRPEDYAKAAACCPQRCPRYTAGRARRGDSWDVF